MVKRRAALVLGAICVGVFVYGIAHLFTLRFSSGDVFPPYSSLRADPLGTKVFYEALAQLPHMEVTRYYRPISKLRDGKNTTLLYLGLPVTSQTDDQEIRDFESLIQQGARLVFAMKPVTDDPERDQSPGAKAGKIEDEKSKSNEKDEAEIKSRSLMTLAERWGVHLKYSKTRLTKDAFFSDDQSDLEDSFSWHSGLFFKDLDPQWKIICTVSGKPVLIERPLGKGSIVLAADSYFFSNEAMRAERRSDLLAWIVGGNSRVMVDETHNGISDDPGIATLAKKYHLQPVIAALCVLAGLFVWKSASSFIPPHPDVAAREEIVTGKDATAGFVNVLRRSIPPKKLLEISIREWKKTFAKHPDFARKCASLDAAIGSAKSSPVSAYLRIAEKLADRSV